MKLVALSHALARLLDHAPCEPLERLHGELRWLESLAGGPSSASSQSGAGTGSARGPPKGACAAPQHVSPVRSVAYPGVWRLASILCADVTVALIRFVPRHLLHRSVHADAVACTTDTMVTRCGDMHEVRHPLLEGGMMNLMSIERSTMLMHMPIQTAISHVDPRNDNPYVKPRNAGVQGGILPSL